MFRTIRNNQTVHGFARILFHVSAVTFSGILAIEAFLPGYFTNWFNPIWFLIIATISGIITIAHKEYD